MAILVTGGTGYIGSHTVVKLLQYGESVIIIDNLVNSKIAVLEAIEKITSKKPLFYKGDIRDEAFLEEIFNTHSIEAVIHFAGLKAVGESVHKPILYYDNNVSGTNNLLQVMTKFGCKKMVFSSSATVYGSASKAPFKETDPLKTTNPYGSSKLMIENILSDVYGSDSTWSIVALRYFNPIGAHKSGLIGEDPNDIPNNLLPYISKVALGELPQLNVFGDDYDTPDGTGIRDYIHVEDLAEGHLKALSFIRKQTVMEAINLGTGKGYSVLEILKAYGAVSKKKLNYQITSRRSGDIGTCYADTSKAKTLLDWTAKKDIYEMCEDAWRFSSKTKRTR